MIDFGNCSPMPGLHLEAFDACGANGKKKLSGAAAFRRIKKDSGPKSRFDRLKIGQPSLNWVAPREEENE